MDWEACIKKTIAKEIKQDKNLVKSLREIADGKIKAAQSLSDEFFISKVTLLYDALRETLESVAIEKGYKIYNHECYTAFIKEILNLSREGDIFDNLRKIRNGINYYGKNLSKEEAEEVISELGNLIPKFKEMSQNIKTPLEK